MPIRLQQSQWNRRDGKISVYRNIIEHRAAEVAARAGKPTTTAVFANQLLLGRHRLFRLDSPRLSWDNPCSGLSRCAYPRHWKCLKWSVSVRLSATDIRLTYCRDRRRRNRRCRAIQRSALVRYLIDATSLRGQRQSGSH